MATSNSQAWPDEDDRPEFNPQDKQTWAAMARFARQMGHDLNNELMVVRGHLDLLQSQLGGQDEAVQILLPARTAAIRCTSMLERLEVYSRQDAPTRQPLDLNTMLRDLATGLTQESNIPLVFHLAPDLPLVPADAAQLSLALVELLKNAMQANPKDPLPIHIRTALRQWDGTAGTEALPAGPYVRLSIADGGCGMTQAQTGQALHPMFSTWHKGCGAGLGLSLAQAVVYRHGGALCLSSHPGQGTRVALWLPLEPQQAPVQAIPSQVASPVAIDDAAHLRVLVIDDNPEVRSLVCLFLADAGYDPQGAENGETGLRLAMETRPQLVVCDIIMPEKEGLETIMALRKQHPTCRILSISGADNREYLNMSELLGANGALAKPFTRDELLQAVQTCLKH